MSAVKIPDAVANLGETVTTIFRALLSHEYMTREKIIEKSGVSATSYSNSMTALRRCGWAEARGNRVNRQWKRREMHGQPQPDFVNRKRRATESDEGDALHHVTEAARHLNTAIKLLGPWIKIQKAIEAANRK